MSEMHLSEMHLSEMCLSETDGSETNWSETRLIPFPDGSEVPRLTIQAMVRRRSGILTIKYRLAGDLAAIRWPGAIADAASPQRRLALWESTCLEFFVGVPGQSQYWEFNLAPNRDWNVYGLSDYRSNLTAAAEFQTLPMTVNQSEQEFHLRLDVDLTPIIAASKPIILSITAVIESQVDGNFSYWAIEHCGNEADFHDRRSFTIQLPPSSYQINE
jgi:hypothetical protein